MRKTELEQRISGVLPEELEFLSEDELVTIVPNFALPEISLIKSVHEQLKPNTPVEVPLWLARVLQKGQRCTIQTPAWLEEDYLRAVFDKEREGAAVFQSLPSAYVELAAHLLQDEGKSRVYKAKDVLEATRKVRSTKIFAGLGMLDSSMTVKLNNFGHMECNNIREFVRMTFDTFYCIEKAKDSVKAASQAMVMGASQGRSLRR